MRAPCERHNGAHNPTRCLVSRYQLLNNGEHTTRHSRGLKSVIGGRASTSVDRLSPHVLSCDPCARASSRVRKLFTLESESMKAQVRSAKKTAHLGVAV